MEINPQEFRRHYASLSDEGLLAINRDDLVAAARDCYDAECAARNIGGPQQVADQPEQTPTENAGGAPVHVATFLDFEEANLARGMLQSAGIPCGFENQSAGALSGPPSLRLMVREEDYERACDLLESEISEEELAALAEAQSAEDPDAET